MTQKYSFRHKLDLDQIQASQPDNGVLVWIDPNAENSQFVLASDLGVKGPDNFLRKIKAGFRYNGASVPKAFRWLIAPADPRIFAAATLHDSFYSKAEGSRFVADALFRAVMTQFGMPYVKMMLAYLAVRVFGGRSFKPG